LAGRGLDASGIVYSSAVDLKAAACGGRYAAVGPDLNR